MLRPRTVLHDYRWGEGVPEPQQEQHDALIARLLPPARTPPTQVGGASNGHRVDLDDQELLRRAFAARNGPKVQTLYAGDISAYSSDSEADLALCRYLAFWTGADPDRIDRLFRGSELMREKWDSPRGGESTYGWQTITKAIESCTQFYSPPAARNRTNGATSPTGDAENEAAGSVTYSEARDGLWWHKPTSTGVVKVRLSNFTARVVADTVVDHGSGETTHAYTLQARLSNGQSREFEVPAGSFSGMRWVSEQLGAHAWLEPGPGLCDRARHAIQTLSKPTDRRVYAHTGWTRLNGDDVYLHAGGGIGLHGPVTDIEVRLPEQLEPFELPNVDPSELGECVRASLELLTLGPLEVTAPLLCSAYRAPLGPVDLTTHGNGPTGAYKTELGAFSQQHYGAGFDSRHLPGSWSSTANFTADLLYVAKDALVVIDDFAPTGSKHNVAQQHRDAERVIRGQGNHSARGRMNADGSTRPSRPPRGLILSTGEDVPGQQSLRARIVVVDIHGDAIDVNRLTSAQAMGAQGMFAKAMAAFLQWLAARGIDRVHRHVTERTCRLRESVVAGEHKRSAANLAQLAVGMEVFLEFASESGAIAIDDANATWEQCWLALMRTAATQSQHQRETNPARVFLSYLAGAITSGRAYLDGTHGGAPDHNANGWGWRDEHRAPGADRVGWVKDDDVFLDPQASYLAAQRFADASAQPLSHQKHALQKMLLDEGLITVGSEREARHTVRRAIGGTPSRRVLHLTPAAVSAIQGDDDTSRRAPEQHDRAFPPIPPITSIARPKCRVTRQSARFRPDLPILREIPPVKRRDRRVKSPVLTGVSALFCRVCPEIPVLETTHTENRFESAQLW